MSEHPLSLPQSSSLATACCQLQELPSSPVGSGLCLVTLSFMPIGQWWLYWEGEGHLAFVLGKAHHQPFLSKNFSKVASPMQKTF